MQATSPMSKNMRAQSAVVCAVIAGLSSALGACQLASGLDFITSFSGVIACINNAGPGLGLVGPGSNYGVLNSFQTWVCSAAMLLGRLEVFTILVLFTPTLWRK